jgi:hypothetical protein
VQSRNVADRSNLRINVDHLSTNPGVLQSMGQGPKVTCSFSKVGSNGLAMTISGFNKYTLASARKHGLSVGYRNMTVTLDGNGLPLGASGASATLSGFSLQTDELPDFNSTLNYAYPAQGSSTPFCTGTITPRVVEVSGTACSSAVDAPTRTDVSVEASGSFICVNLPSSTATGVPVDVSNGEFFCMSDVHWTPCPGGGGGGGGPPPEGV